jgi:serine/threonine-protein kinase
VFLAEDMELERSVALKVMSAELAQDAEQRKRFRTEARAASGVIHPNVCVIHEIGETEDGRPFLAMEYVEGQSLARVMQERRLRIREVLALGIEVAGALEAAHGRGLVHRDIKPTNLMLNRQGQVKVLDFGLARRFGQEELRAATTELTDTKAGTLLGTPHYLSPEQALGRDLDHRTDIFSLGVVLYELVAGQRPFPGRTVGETINNVINQQPESLGLENALISPTLDGIIFKCLEKDPARRYPTAKALADDLISLRRQIETAEVNQQATSSAIPALPPTAFATPEPQRAAAETKPARFPALTMALAGLGLLAVLAVVVARLHRPSTQPEPDAQKNSAAFAVPHSVAVLPFDNFSGEPNTDYLSDGLTEEITTALSRIHGLKVAARNSAFTFKGKKDDVRWVGVALQVGTVLEGSIRKAGKQIHVNVQLINVADGFSLWSETYDRPVDDLIAVQEDIARRIAERLQGTLSGALEAHKAINPEAHKLYLQGRLFWNKRTEAGLEKARQFFQEAIAHDQSYAGAHAGLAATYLLLPLYSPKARPADYNPLARASANRALELDPTCAEAHAVMGNVFAEAKDSKAAEEHFQLALNSDPNYATAHQWYGRYLAMHGKVDKALGEFQAAVALDPLSPVIRTTIPDWYYLTGDYDRAISESRKVIESFPDFPTGRLPLIMALFMKSQYREALPEIDQARALQPEDPLADLELRGFALARLGEKEKAEEILSQLEEHGRQGKRVSGAMSFIYLGLRNYDKSIDELEKVAAAEGLDHQILFNPLFAEIRNLPRVQALMKKAGLISDAQDSTKSGNG